MATKLWAIVLVVICTLFASVAQIFYKIGAARLPLIFTNWQLLLGMFLYITGAIILLVSFKGGDLTVLYPVFATSYIWVGLMSNYFFSEELNFFKLAGMLSIILGISLMGFGIRKSLAFQEVTA